MARTVSIRRSLLLNLVAIVLLLGAAILAMTFVGGERAMQRFSQSLMEQTLSRTEVELRRFFGPVNRYLRTLTELNRSGALTADDPEVLNEQLSSFMRQHPWVTSCMFANDAGREHMLLRVDDLWRARRVLDPDGTRLALWSEWTDEGEAKESEEVLDYDPRSRPWYRGALQKLEAARSGGMSLHWTEPYTFFTTKEPGITVSAAFRAPDGSPRVIGLDVLLIDISRFTTEIEVHASGSAFVLADDGRIVGMPRGPQFRDEAALKLALLKRPGELGTPVARDLSDALLGGEGIADRATRFQSEGGAWWGQLRRFELGSDRYLVIGVAVPEADLLANVRDQRVWIGVLTVVALAVAVGRAVALAGRYSHPVEELVHESERIATGDLEPGPLIDTEVAEIRRLASAHDKMRQGLETLLRIEHDLKIARRIQESTFPDRLPELEGFDLAAWSEPADETGGDTYDVIGVHGATIGDKIVITEEDAGRAVLLLADATGHGIGPALSVTQVRAMLRIAVRMSFDLSEIATHINQQLCADLPTGRFITCWLGELSSEDGTLTTISGGQAPLLRYRAASDEFDVLSADTTPFGLFDHGKIEVPPSVRLESGDIYAVISDGIFEAADPSDEEFGVERTQDVIRQHRTAPAAEILAQIRDAAEAFTRGAPAADDRTIILIKRV